MDGEFDRPSSRERSAPAGSGGTRTPHLPLAVGGMAVRQIAAVVRVASEATIVPLFDDLGAGLSRLTLAVERPAGARATLDRLADAVERLDEVAADGGSLARIADMGDTLAEIAEARGSLAEIAAARETLAEIASARGR